MNRVKLWFVAGIIVFSHSFLCSAESFTDKISSAWHSLWGDKKSDELVSATSKSNNVSNIVPSATVNFEQKLNNLNDLAVEITLYIAEITPENIAALAQATANRLHNLTRLIVKRANRQEHITPEQLVLLGENLPDLTVLNLQDTGLNGPSLAALKPLITGKYFTKLDTLDLSNNPLDDSDIDALSQFSEVLPADLMLPPLKWLNIANLNLQAPAPSSMNFIKRGIMSTLLNKILASVRLSLAILDLSGNTIGDFFAYFFANTPLVGALKFLNLSNTGITREGIERLAQSTSFKELTELDLSNNMLTDNDIEALAKAPFVPQLKYLNVQHNAFTNPAHVKNLLGHIETLTL